MRFREAFHYRELILAKADQIMVQKACDYSGSASGDIFANLRACETFGIMSAELGVWVRLSDKVARLGSLLKERYNPAAVLDTVVDLINYATYVYLLMIEKDPAYARLLEEKKDERQVKEE
jgi:hypothetical protein